MNGLYRSALPTGLLCCAVLLGPAAHAADDPVTEPERCVFLGVPQGLAYLHEENLILMVNSGGVYAFDIASGARRWHRYLVSSGGPCGATFGKRQVLGWSDQGVFLLDAATGRETWWRRENQYGAIGSAKLSPDETRVAVSYERAGVLYSVADRTQRILPRVTNAHIYGWFPGNKTLLIAQYERREKDTVLKYMFMDTDSGAVTPGWERAYSAEERPPIFSPLGQFAQATAEGEDSTALKILDARTGTVLREFKDTPGRTKHFLWLRDGKRLFSLIGVRKQARVFDAETGMVQFSLSREGHSFSYTPFEDASGRAWIFSQDEANTQYVWPLTSDGAPRKVLDGGRLAPGNFQLHTFDQCYVLTSRAVADPVWAHTLYTLEDMRKTAEWRFRIPERGSGTMINQAMTHYVKAYQAVKDDKNRSSSMAFSVYVRDNETPVLAGQGNPIAVSPDAKYLVVQTDDSTTSLYDTETGRMVSQFSVPARENVGNCMKAAFSDDGKRLVMNINQAIEVTDLTEGYPRRPMTTGGEPRLQCAQPRLSPDGTRVLCGGYGGGAWLFDADTGALLHSFEETERFARKWPPGDGFWNGLAATAKDWAGMVTDQFKQDSEIEVAFTDGGSRVITHAAGQVIRVWDAGSGRLLQTIHTGLPEKRDKDGYIRNRIVLSTNGRFAFCYNENNFGTASLWSLADGTLQRSYQLPESLWPQAVPTDDGTAVYIKSNDSLYRWPGVSKEEK